MSATLNQDGAQRRNRVKLSCAECRRLKLRCDKPGVWPCQTCRKRGCADVCPNGTLRPTGRSSKAQLEVVQLAKRLEELEGVLKEAGLGLRIPPPLELEFKHLKEDGTGDEGSAKEASAMNGNAVAGPAAVDPLDGIMDGVGSLSIREEDGRTRFLGTSAGSAYFAAGEADSSEDEQEDEFTKPPDGVTLYPWIQLGTAYPKQQELDRLRSFLPSEEEGRRLAKCYWTYLSFMFEPLEESVFYDDYFPKAYERGDHNGTILACVFIILCLGALFDPDQPSTPNERAAHYFVVCQNVLTCSRFLSNNTIAGAQTLQLMANYLFCQHNLQEGGESFFPILGAALRMLQTMGLHRDGTKWGLTGPELDRRRLVFYELMTLERMQAFICGRPYLMNPNHFDTQMPSNAPPYQIWKWKLGIFLGRVIDEGFSVKLATVSLHILSPPPYISSWRTSLQQYGTIQMLDEELRGIFAASPKTLRSGALPETAFIIKPAGAPSLPPSPHPDTNAEELKQKQRQHTLDMVFAQIFFYLHKPAFARALTLYPAEPLASPWSASVAAVSLETGVYMLAIAKSWVYLHPVVNPRWWHIFFHAFAASVAQSSLVIRSPGSMLARHAWGQLNLAVEIFVAASIHGAPVASFVPRLRTLRDTAYTSLQSSLSIPPSMGAPASSAPSPAAPGNDDAELSILGPTTRLDRRPKRIHTAGHSPGSTGSQESGSSLYRMTGQDSAFPLPPSVGYTGNHLEDLASLRKVTSPRSTEGYTPFDSPLTLRLPQQKQQTPWPVTAGPPGFSSSAIASISPGMPSQKSPPPFRPGSAGSSHASLQHELNLQHSYGYPASTSPGTGSGPASPYNGLQFANSQMQPPQQYQNSRAASNRQSQPAFRPSVGQPSTSSQPAIDPFSNAQYGQAPFAEWGGYWGGQDAVTGESIDAPSELLALDSSKMWWSHDLVNGGGN
ncbi:hypothetical protein P7C70_g4153, partial [Phenoliferia sp. Uapishka_3]